MAFAKRMRGLGGLAAALAAVAAATPALAVDDGDAFKAEMRARMEAQDARIRELEAELRAARGGMSPGDAGVSGELDRFLRAKDMTAKGTSAIRFYGFVRLDAIWDDSRVSNTQTVGWVRSEDPTAPGGEKKNDRTLTIHPRLTRFGFDLDAGKVAALDDAHVTGKIEVDFYNSGLAGQAESRAALRMRHAYVKMAWGATSILAGQTTDLISPLWPAANPDLVMWGTGNLGDRRPQARIESEVGGDDVKVRMGFMAGLTGADDNQNLDGNGFRDGEASGLPTLQARTALRFPVGSKTAEVGVWGHRAWERTDALIAGKRHFDSVAVGADWSFPLGPVTLQGEWYRGRNLDDVRGGIFQGINAATNDEIHTWGGWLELGWKISGVVSVHAGHTRDDPDNGDVGGGGRGRNRVHYVGARWNLDPVEFGVDYMYWLTDWVAQRDGRDHRVQAFVAFKF